MKNYQKLFYIFLILTVFANVGISKADNEYIYDLRGSYQDPVSKKLRKTFNIYANKPASEIKKSSYPISQKHQKLFKKKFLVLDIRQCELGGYYVDILINPKKIHAWRVQVFDTGNGRYEIRKIIETKLEKETLPDMREFTSKENMIYWQ